MVEERIDSSKLAQMLNEGFKGKINFSGRVYGVIEEAHTFYATGGDLSLCGFEGEEGYCLIKSTEKSGAELWFKPKKDLSIKLDIIPYEASVSQEKEVIRFPIDLTENCFLHIEDPKNIIYTSFH